MKESLLLAPLVDSPADLLDVRSLLHLLQTIADDLVDDYFRVSTKRYPGRLSAPPSDATETPET